MKPQYPLRNVAYDRPTLRTRQIDHMELLAATPEADAMYASWFVDHRTPTERHAS